MSHVFISYSRADAEFASTLGARINGAGIEVWLDKGVLVAGQDWGAEIDQAILSSYVVVVVMSPDAQASEYVTYEWSFAIGAGIQVIPVLHRQTSLHPRLARLHYLDFTSPSAEPWEEFMRAVTDAVRLREFQVVRVPRNAPPHVKNAVASLDAPDQGERAGAVAVLAQTAHPAAREALRSALRHPMPDVRWGAAKYLTGEPEALAVLVEAAMSGDNDAASSLLTYGDAAVRALREVLAGGSLTDAERILALLRRYPPEIIGPHLPEILQSPDPHARRVGVLLLQSDGDRDEFERALFGALRDADREVRSAAARVALSDYGLAKEAPRFYEALSLIFHDPDPAVRAEAAAVRDFRREAMLEPLESLLGAERMFVAVSAYTVLRHIAAEPDYLGGPRRLQEGVTDILRAWLGRDARPSDDDLVPGRVLYYAPPYYVKADAGLYVIAAKDGARLEIGALHENPETNEFEVGATRSVVGSDLTNGNYELTRFKLPTPDDPTFVVPPPVAEVKTRAAEGTAAAAKAKEETEEPGDFWDAFLGALWLGLKIVLQCGIGTLFLFVGAGGLSKGMGLAHADPYDSKVTDTCGAGLMGVVIGLVLWGFGLGNIYRGLAAVVRFIFGRGGRGERR